MSLTSVEPPLDQNVADDKLLRLLLQSHMTVHLALGVKALLSIAHSCEAKSALGHGQHCAL